MVFLAQALPSNEKAPFGFDLRYTQDLVVVFDQSKGCGLATVSQNCSFKLQSKSFTSFTTELCCWFNISLQYAVFNVLEKYDLFAGTKQKCEDGYGISQISF